MGPAAEAEGGNLVGFAIDRSMRMNLWAASTIRSTRCYLPRLLASRKLHQLISPKHGNTICQPCRGVEPTHFTCLEHSATIRQQIVGEDSQTTPNAIARVLMGGPDDSSEVAKTALAGICLGP